MTRGEDDGSMTREELMKRLTASLNRHVEDHLESVLSEYEHHRFALKERVIEIAMTLDFSKIVEKYASKFIDDPTVQPDAEGHIDQEAVDALFDGFSDELSKTHARAVKDGLSPEEFVDFWEAMQELERLRVRREKRKRRS